MEPSWLQNCFKLGCWFEGCFWKDVRTIFINVLPQHDMAEVAKTLKNQLFFNVFQFLVVVLLGWFVDWFLIDFCLILGSKINWKSIKNHSKKESKIRCKLGWILDGSWTDLGAILGPSWGASWGQVGTKIWKMGVPRRCQKMSSKTWAQATRDHAGNGGVGPYKPLTPRASRGRSLGIRHSTLCLGGTVADKIRRDKIG